MKRLCVCGHPYDEPYHYQSGHLRITLDGTEPEYLCSGCGCRNRRQEEAAA